MKIHSEDSLSLKAQRPRIRQQRSGEIMPVNQFSHESKQMKKFLSSRSLTNKSNEQASQDASRLTMLENVPLEQLSQTSPADGSQDNTPRVGLWAEDVGRAGLG